MDEGRRDTLNVEDFAQFFKTVHGAEPFAWQRHLVAEIIDSQGVWPEVIDVPTGMGKTSTIDVAVFTLAARWFQTGRDTVAARSAREQAGGSWRRLFFVVDRRLIVDEAFEHAMRLVDALHLSSDPAVMLVARAFREMAPGLAASATDDGSIPGSTDGSVPLVVARLRGGIPHDGTWSNRPDQPAIVISTVDQIGSRILFRGYGLSDRRRPIDAALAGTDSLMLVDEAHLAQALVRTLGQLSELDQPIGELTDTGWRPQITSVVTMSATVGEASTKGGQRRFVLDPREHGVTNGRPSPEASGAAMVAAQRLTAHKSLRLVESEPKKAHVVLADAAAALSTRDPVCEENGSKRILVVCNTVDRARAVFERLSLGRTRVKDADVDLLIGRSRGADRVGLNRRILDRFGLQPSENSRAAILVATQTVEVGINLDADVLITECASWDALVQRLGRLNRLGLRGTEQAPAQAIVVGDGSAATPVYGEAAALTWAFLCEELRGKEVLDASPLACRALTGRAPAGSSMRSGEQPLLTRPILEHWARTGPVPTVDPDIAPHLHGFDRGVGAVTLIWREGLVRPSGSVDLDDGLVEIDESSANALLDAVPVTTAECVEVPLPAVRRWLRRDRSPGTSDLDVDLVEDMVDVREPIQFPVLRKDRDSSGEPRWRWMSDDNSLRPGDLLVVPVENGGLDEYGWTGQGSSTAAAASDVAELAALDSHRLMFRLDHGLGRRLRLPEPVRSRVSELSDGALAAFDTGPDWDGAESVAAAQVGIGRDRIRALLDAVVSGLSSLGDSTSADASLADWPTARREAITDLARQAAQDSALLINPVSSDSRVGFGVNGPVLTVVVSVRRGRESAVLPDETADITASSVTGGRVTLENHGTSVRERALEIATNVGVPAELKSVLADAALWHDLGKVEERFQAMLWGGNALEVLIAAEPIAKSGMDPGKPGDWLLARKRSGLPHRARHEAWSSALIRAYVADHGYPGDSDLLIHLIASHHGHSRPLLPPVVDQNPRPITAKVAGQEVRVDSAQTVDLEHPERFASLNERYGRWGLALMEAIVRCADTTTSGEGK